MIRKAITIVIAPLFLLLGICSLHAQPQVPIKIPLAKEYNVLVSHKLLEDKQYLAFPALITLPDNEVLITFKRGTAHGNDVEADCDMIRLNTQTHKVIEHATIGHIPERKFQLTVPLSTNDGNIHFYTDLQHTGPDGRHYREGMAHSVTSDGGRSFSSWENLGVIDGVEYGYPFDFIIEGETIYMLAMSFGYRPGGLWSVAVLKSTDNAKSWSFIKDITNDLGTNRINESSFVRTQAGFAIVLRGYGSQPTLITTYDYDFNLRNVKELTGTGVLEGLIGWPRIFSKNGNLYVIGRIRTPDSQYMQLGLIKINSQTLDIEQVVILDNENGNTPVFDAYYAGIYWSEQDGETWFNAVTYRAIAPDKNPDIIRLGFRWDEIQ